ncbi:MAG TPA: lanthionine synthetase LanC family protein [Bryobacteraceae bacterium]|nr:lanthionine synthetase LanC family protein [Bryobacteraceae bacterium]
MIGTGALDYLGTAAQIGRRVIESAIWHEDRCNWLGAEPLERWDGVTQAGVTYRTLGPDLYSGTSGVALFLAELFGVTREPAVRRTALGAMRHALARADSVSDSARLGLFSGWIGLALASVRVGMILEEPELAERARRRLQSCIAEKRGAHDFDLMSGRAGAIAGLAVLSTVLEDSFVLDFAVRLGDELLKSAERAEIGYSWQSRTVENHRNLTGFSHGASGAGYALLELFQLTGVSKYRDAALRAFEYERHWFDSKVGNWPDFRKDPLSPQRKKRYDCLSYWCHGAPGIALARLRAYEILNDETCLAEALTAMATTRAEMVSALENGTGNFSLCHGLAGNSEAVLYGAELLLTRRGEDIAPVFEAACYGIERYARPDAAWPCGTHSGETPNLMLGLAGIGHYYLRLYRQSIPSILILRRNAWKEAALRKSA